VPVPAAPLAGALLMKISALYRSCCALVGAPEVWSRCCSSSRLRHPALTPLVRAHYPIKGCQLLRKVQQLIRRKKIFKVPVGGLLDGLSPCRCVLLRCV